MTSTRTNIPSKLIFGFTIYILINITMHLFSIENASYIHGADADRYFIPALNLATGKGLGELTYTGPLYPIYIAAHIHLTGESNALLAIVISQSILLFMTGYIITLLAKNLGLTVTPIIVLMFVILNPNSLMIAHLIQTETLFTFLLSVYFFYLHKYFNSQNLKTLLIISFTAVLISFTRPAGMYVMALFSIVSIPIFFKSKERFKWFKHNIIYLVILSIGLTSVGMYNRNIHGEFFITANKGHVFHDQYVALLQFGNGLSSSEALLKARNSLSNKLSLNYIDCAEKMTSIRCKDEVASIYINEIINASPKAIVKGFATSVSSLLFAGGASNFSNYYGLGGKNHIIELEQTEGGLYQINKLIKFASNINIAYFAALLIFWGWAIVTKILMTIGLVKEINKGNNLYFVSTFIIISLFIIEYLFLGQSRWRAPIDPILMMFAAVGFSFIFKKILKLKYTIKE